MIHAVGINMEQNNQENNKLFFSTLEGSRITKRGFWVWISDKSKKGGNFKSAGRFGLRRYGAQSRIGDSRINSGDRAVSCEKKS